MSDRRAAAENRDIRKWAASRGIELAPTGRIRSEVREAWAADGGGAQGGDVAADAPAPGVAEELARLESVAGGETAPGTAQETVRRGPVETAPVEPPRRRLWQRNGAGNGPKRRESLETIGAFAWGGLAQTAARQGRIPTARMLTLQAPVAGMLLDDVARGTLIDRLLQPFARTGKRGEALFALLGPPLLVEAMCRFPDRQAQLMPVLAAALESYADLAGPKLAAARRRAEKRVQDIGGSGDIAEMIAMIFAPAEGPPGAAAAA